MRNNSVNFNDPTGHCEVVCVAAIVVSVATVAGAVGGALGYMAYNHVSGEKFDSKSFLVATVGGGVTSGVATFGFVVSGFNPVVFLGLMGAGNAGQYAADRALHDDPVSLLKVNDDINLVAQFGIGVVGGAIGGVTSSSFLTGPAKRMAIEFGEQTFTRFGKEVGRMFLKEMMEESMVSSVRSSVSTFATSIINKVWNKFPKMEKE